MKARVNPAKALVITSFDQYLLEVRRGAFEYSVVLGRRHLCPEKLKGINEALHEYGVSSLTGLPDVKANALELVRGFFEYAGSRGCDWLSAFASKVPLSIPDYQDFKDICLLLAFAQSADESRCGIFVPSNDLEDLVNSLLGFNGEKKGLAGWPGKVAYLRFFRTLLRSAFNKPGNVDVRVLFFSLSGPEYKQIDSYFGDLPEICSKIKALRRVYLASGPKIRLSKDQESIPLEAFTTVRDVLLAWREARFKQFKVDRQDKCALSIYGQLYDWLQSIEIKTGERFMHAFYARAFRRMVDAVNPSVVVYPFENRSWEKLLVGATKDKNASSIAYSHSSITPRHLAFEISDADDVRSWLPDYVVTIGDVTAKWLEEKAPPLRGRIMAGVSFRAVDCYLDRAARDSVLVAVSSSRDEAWDLLQLTYEASINVDIPFVVRSHPTIPIKDMFSQFSWPSNVSLSCDVSLAEDIRRASIVAYSSSTVALEAMRSGRIPLFLDIGDLPVGDPLPDGLLFKYEAACGIEYANQIKSIISMDSGEFESVRGAAVEYANKYLRLPDDKVVHEIVQLIVGQAANDSSPSSVV